MGPEPRSIAAQPNHRFARLSLEDPRILSFIAWAYLVSNGTRVLTYVPQIMAVWRCEHGARSASILTWGSWAASNLAAVLYGVLVITDGFFVAISMVNLIGCGAVTAIVSWKRSKWQRAQARR